MKELIKNRVERSLSKEYHCSPKDLNTKETIYTVDIDAGQPYIKILAYRDCVVICTSKKLHSKVQGLLQDKNKDEIFEFPFVYGQTIHYVPDAVRSDHTPPSSDLHFSSLFDGDVLSLNGLTGFENALAFDPDGSTPTKTVYIAKDGTDIVGMAGAAVSAVDGLWEIGIDVIEGYRNTGLGTYLVTSLTRGLLERDIIPFYSASVTNIGSQMVAARCGYIPSWVDTYSHIFDRDRDSWNSFHDHIRTSI